MHRDRDARSKEATQSLRAQIRIPSRNLLGICGQDVLPRSALEVVLPIGDKTEHPFARRERCNCLIDTLNMDGWYIHGYYWQKIAFEIEEFIRKSLHLETNLVLEETFVEGLLPELTSLDTQGRY